MTEVVFLLEEESAKAMLESLVPRILGADANVRYIVFEGKQDLDRQIVKRMRGYLRPDVHFLVLRDVDSHPDCRALKASLVEQCARSGRGGVSTVRLACKELESFYLGDLAAVEAVFGIKGLAARQNSAKFREPDRLGSPSQELKRLTQGIYTKVAGSRELGKHLDIDANSSQSFRCLAKSLVKLSQPSPKPIERSPPL